MDKLQQLNSIYYNLPSELIVNGGRVPSSPCGYDCIYMNTTLINSMNWNEVSYHRALPSLCRQSRAERRHSN
jgi:hypothetical protein